MNPNREELLFQLALLKSPDERAGFLDRECGDDNALRQRVEALLAAHQQTQGALADAPPAAVATMKIEFADAPDETIGQRIGRYKILEKVGEGGCGVVYVAEQTEPVRRRVALKVIKLGMDTKTVVARFEAERQALAMMDHPNIAKVLDAGTTEIGRPYFVMELVRGIKLTDYCDQNNLPTRERLNLFIQVCHAIQHAHQKGIIHRDIKPSNILVTLHDGVPIPKVIDFGIAKATEGRLTDATIYTQLHQFIGTPAYMSPEQAEMSGLDVDTRSDIYSLGVLLYELLAGSTPFDGKELMSLGIDAMRKTIREKEPVRPSTKLATLKGEELTTTAKRRSVETSKLANLMRGDLDWIVMKCLEKDRTRRYDTANGLAADLKRHLNNEPVVARPPSAAYKFQKALRRNKLAFTAAGAVTVALVLGMIASTWQSVRAIQAKREAVAAQANESVQRQLAEQETRRAEEARKLADRETLSARRVAAQADARFLLQERLLPDALVKATEAYKLGGEWEDGLLIHNIAAVARNTWALSARIPLSEPVTVACATDVNGASCLVLYTGSGLRVLDASTGATLGSAPYDQVIKYLFKGSQSNTVVAVSGPTVSLLALPSLAIVTNRIMASPSFYATAKGNNLLLLLQNHDVHLLDLGTLSEMDGFNWDQNPIAKEIASARHGCTSPDGKIVVLHGGSWNLPSLVWDRRADPPTFYTNQIPQQEFQFVDNTHFAAWTVAGQGEGDTPATIDLYEVGQKPVRLSSQSVPNDDLKGHLQFQTWNSKDWNFDASFPILGMVGPSGVVVKGISGTGDKDGDFTVSDRYANLLPLEADPPSFLAADFANGVLAVHRQNENELLVFRLVWPYWNGRIREYCGTACREGLLCINYFNNLTSVRLNFVPFDPAQKLVRVNLQWQSDSKWLPWAIAATPDGSTVAVIAQETDSDSRITAQYGRIRALIYHPGSLTNSPSAWPIVNYFEVEGATDVAFSPRFVALDPRARTLLYWNSATTCIRYDTRDGRSLGSLELGPVSARSRDGNRVAGISPSGHLRVYDLASGNRLLDLADKPATNLCFSTDGSCIVAAQTNTQTLTTYEVTSGKALVSVHSSLLPLAYPSRGNRFLGFQADSTGTGGSVVLADTSDAHIVAVLNRAGSLFTPAFFSDSGEQLAVVRNRDFAEVLRSLRPEDLSAVLNSHPFMSAIASITSTNLVTSSPHSPAILDVEDASGLLSHMGDKVTVQGHVRNVSIIQARDAANIYFETSSQSTLMVWVPFKVFPKMVALYGEDLGAALNGRTIKVTGKLSKYKDALEVILDAPSDLTVVDPVIQANPMVEAKKP